MMFDFQNLFSDKQALAGTDESILSEFSLRLQKDNPERVQQGWTPIHDVGRGTPILVQAQIVADVVGGTSVQAQIIAADDEELTSNVVVLQETAAIPVAQLKAGYRFNLGAVPETGGKKHLGMRYVVAGTVTDGAVTAGLVLDKQTTY